MKKISWCVGLFCLMLFAGLVYKTDQSPVVAQKQAASGNSATATFSFVRYTGNKRFRLNTLQTTTYGPPWANIVEKPSNFLECEGAAIALCYYSGPGPTTPCNEDGLGLANCTCYQIPAGKPYLVDINAILNLDVYLETVSVCGKDGSKCRPYGRVKAPVCNAINNNTLIPGADLVSAFSLYLEKESVTENEKEFFIVPTSCPTAAPYAGCMTAPCKRTGKTDPKTGLPLVQCGCPIYNGPYQYGKNTLKPKCDLGGSHVWSAAYSPPMPAPTATPAD